MSRDESISISRAIAIILMVVAHAGIWKSVNHVIYTFHMPLFFIMSGMCFKENYLTKPLLFVKRKLLGVYWPYIKWSLVFLCLHNICFKFHLYDAVYGFQGVGTPLYTMHDYLMHARDVIFKMEGHENLLGTFWFMKQLFLGNLLFYGVLRLVKNHSWMASGILIILAFAMNMLHQKIPYIEITYLVPYSASFIAIGYSLKSENIDYHEWSNKSLCLIICLLVTVMLLGAFINPRHGMLSQSSMTLLPYMIPAVAGTLCTLLFSRWLLKRVTNQMIIRLLCFVGEHSFEIMALHFLSFKLVSLLIVKQYGLPIGQIAEHPVVVEYAHNGWWPAYSVVGVVLPLVYAYCKKLGMNLCYRHRENQ